MNRANNAELMKNQTFGVEIEMSKIDKEDARDIVANYYNTMDSCDYDGGNHDAYSCLDSKGRKWQFMDDGSSSGRLGHIECEMVTPVLTYDDITDLQQIVRNLRQAGAKSGANYNAGVHIHVGSDTHRDGRWLVSDDGGQTPSSIRNLINMAKSHENLLLHAVNVNPSRYNWCRLVDDYFLHTINHHRHMTWQQLENAWYNDDLNNNYIDVERTRHYNATRYHMINLHSMFYGHTTIEFRLFEFKDTMHAGELKAWIQLCLAMCSYAKLVRNCSSTPVSVLNEKYAMKNWLVNMGLVGDEFSTCRKMLLKRLSGDCAYANGQRPYEDDIDDSHLFTE